MCCVGSWWTKSNVYLQHVGLLSPFISQCVFQLFSPYFHTLLRSHWTHHGLSCLEHSSNLTVYSRGAWPSFSTAIWLVKFRVSLTFLKSSMLPYCTSTTSPCREEQTHKLSSFHKWRKWSLPNYRSALLLNLYSAGYFILNQKVTGLTLTFISTLSFVIAFLFPYS